MKTLFQNYCSTLSTEAMYFHRCFQEAGEDALMWGDLNQSAFDTFDYASPDLFVTHFRFLTNDIMKYLSGNSKIDMVLNVTGATKENINELEDLFSKSNIKTPIMFTNLYEANNNLGGASSKVQGIYPGADVFLPVMPTPEYKLENCFFSLDQNEELEKLKQNEEEYHTISFNPSSEVKYSDMTLDVTTAVSFYHKYKNCHLIGDINFVSSQILFDCLLKADAVKIKVPKDQQETLDSIFTLLFKEPPKEHEKEEMVNIIKGQIKKRHNCFKRASRLARLIKNGDLSNKLERMSDKL